VLLRCGLGELGHLILDSYQPGQASSKHLGSSPLRPLLCAHDCIMILPEDTPVLKRSRSTTSSTSIKEKYEDPEKEKESIKEDSSSNQLSSEDDDVSEVRVIQKAEDVALEVGFILCVYPFSGR